jgi:hypothetical protein
VKRKNISFDMHLAGAVAGFESPDHRCPRHHTLLEELLVPRRPHHITLGVTPGSKLSFAIQSRSSLSSEHTKKTAVPVVTSLTVALSMLLPCFILFCCLIQHSFADWPKMSASIVYNVIFFKSRACHLFLTHPCSQLFLPEL